MLSQDKAIGGYFDMELPAPKKMLYQDELLYQSARAAFFSLLKGCTDISRVWMPSYICNSMLLPVTQSGKEIKHYTIDSGFLPSTKIKLRSGDLLLYVNYFGINHDNVAMILSQYDPESIVIDCSQAFFSGPYDCLASIYSARKFFGVPDGGILCTQTSIMPPAEQDEDSIVRTTHLLQRLAFSAERGYESYKLAEASLDDFRPKRMSKLTTSFLSSIDYEFVKAQRRANFSALHANLASYNSLALNFDVASTPMCYPFLPTSRVSKSRLAEKRIFVPTYWAEVKDRAETGEFEKLLVDQLLSLPCDQRYFEADISRINKEVMYELFYQRD